MPGFLVPLLAGLGGAAISAIGSNRAANTVADSSDRASAEQRRQFDIALGLQRPAIEAGNAARNRLQRLLGLVDSDGATDIISETPGFQFQLEQGARALNANRSAGGVSGGELLKDFTRFNQGTAASFYQDYANRLANLSGTGQTAATNAAGQSIAVGGQLGNSIQNAGSARASGILGTSRAAGGFLNDIASAIGSGAFSSGGINQFDQNNINAFAGRGI